LLVVLVAQVACSDKKAPVPGKTCLVNTDCDNPLSCTYGKCHEACREDVDCPTDQVCVFAAVTGAAADAALVRVCILERCTFDSGCIPPLICGRDLKCRNQCMEAIDCPGERQQCVVGGPMNELVCVEPAAVDDGGVLMSVGDGGFPRPDSGAPDGIAGDAPADLASSSDVSSSDLASSDLVSDVASASDGDALSSADAGLEVSADAPPSLVAETEPNDTKETARPYVLGTKVQGTIAGNPNVADLDHYALTTPMDPAAGGYFEAFLTDVGNGTLNAWVYAVADNGEIGRHSSIAIGSSFRVFWTAKAGAKYLLVIRPFTSSSTPTYPYTLEVKYTPVADVSEPNDTRDTPRTIAPGQAVSAFYLAGYEQASITPAAFHDWYAVPLGAGPAMIKIANVPQTINMRVAVYDEDFARLDDQSGPNAGATFTLPLTVPKAGTYRLAVDALVAPPTFGTATALPEHFTRPYTLTVTQ
jgi:hypothetical protein